MRTGRSRLSTGLAAIGAVLLVVGLVAWVWQSSTARPPDAPRVPATARASDPAASGTTSAAEPVLAERRPGAPRRVLIPDLGVRASVVPVQAPNDTLVPPSDPDQLGWWADGAAPGAARGSALVAGHTVHTGGGQLDDLERVRPGDRVRVRTSKGVIPYEVTSVKIYRKASLAKDSAELFRQNGSGRLVLITCEDWDGSKYLSNVVVIADPR